MRHLFCEPFLVEITKTLGVRPHEVQGLGIARQLCEVILEQIGPVIHFLSGAHKITVKIDSISLPSFLAVQDSSISDIVCPLVPWSLGRSQLTIRALGASKSYLRH